jgi:hypothetical protein
MLGDYGDEEGELDLDDDEDDEDLDAELKKSLQKKQNSKDI